jgi:hypothetical protein
MNKDGLTLEENVTIPQVNEKTKSHKKLLQRDNDSQHQQEEENLDLIEESKVILLC